ADVQAARVGRGPVTQRGGMVLLMLSAITKQRAEVCCQLQRQRGMVEEQPRTGGGEGGEGLSNEQGGQNKLHGAKLRRYPVSASLLGSVDGIIRRRHELIWRRVS